jgi:N-acetylglucosamine-6-phosphate deacetylase
MIVLAGARIVTPDGMLDPGTLVIDGDRIADVHAGRRGGVGSHTPLDGHVIVPGFVDVHVHGIEGVDALDSADAVADMAARLPRHGVTAFCPTSLACPPWTLRQLFEGIRLARASPAEGRARVLPAHLESNFINPEYRGAQPAACLRLPLPDPAAPADQDFSTEELLAELAAGRDALGLVTLAPELPGALDLVYRLTQQGHRVSLGHSAATYEQGLAGFDAGARHATHLFNRMPPFAHRAPGLVGAVLERPDVTAEIIADGYHVHPTVVRSVLPALGPHRVLAITDGTAGSGLPPGTRTSIGGAYAITVGADVARLDDGTFAGSVLTMGQAFRNAVRLFGMTLQDAARACSTNPAAAVGLEGAGAIVPGALADLAVLDADLRVVQTYVGGRPAVQGRSGRESWAVSREP